MVKLLKKFIFRLYVIGLMVFTVWYGTFMYPLIFGFSGKEGAEASLREMGRAGTAEEQVFIKLISEQGKTTKTDLGYTVIEQPYIEGRFHHIGFEIEPDLASPCIRCHGAVPHDKSKEVRSFLNMHAFYLACESCHVKPQEGGKPWQFKWSEKATGNVLGNPKKLVDIDMPFQRDLGADNKYAAYGDYGAKISPGYEENGQFRFVSNQKDIEFVLSYIDKQKLLGASERSQMKKVIHRKVGNKPLDCIDCHQEEKPYLPLAELGYPPRRLEDLTSASVVGMIRKYKQFWIPSFLNPGVGNNKTVSLNTSDQ